MHHRARGPEQSARKPIGGFCFITATALLAAYMAYRRDLVRLIDLRVWLACHELQARRCKLQKGQKPRYTIEELHGLVGGAGGEHLRRSLRRLTEVKLLVWGESELDLTVDVSKLPGRIQHDIHVKTPLVVNVRRKVPVPRQVIKMLAQGTTRAQVATVLGHLLRGLYYRRGKCVSGGTCKASWVSEVFEVDVRNVKAARKRLTEIGWIVPQTVSQNRLNRWGVLFTVNLSWSQVKGHTAGTESPPPTRLSTTQSPPPNKYKKLSTRSKHQKPAPSGPSSGVCRQTGGRQTPVLRDVQPEDLGDPQRLNQLFRQAVEQGLVTQSENDRLKFFAAAEHARTVGTSNSEGLFATMLRQGLWKYIALRDEDAARTQLSRLAPGSPSPKGPLGNIGWSSVTKDRFRHAVIIATRSNGSPALTVSGAAGEPVSVYDVLTSNR